MGSLGDRHGKAGTVIGGVGHVPNNYTSGMPQPARRT
jgi:hypothetical protein